MKNTSLCYIHKNGQVLMLYRNKKKQDPNAGKWVGIGGKFLEGESPEECMLREVREETGLTVTDFRYAGIVTFAWDGGEGEYMHLFEATDYEGTLHECDEGTLKWFPRDEILSLPLWEGDPIFLRLLWENRPFFSLKLQYRGDDLDRAILNHQPL